MDTKQITHLMRNTSFLFFCHTVGKLQQNRLFSFSLFLLFYSGMLGHRSHTVCFSSKVKLFLKISCRANKLKHKVTQALHCSIRIFVLPPFHRASMFCKLDF